MELTLIRHAEAAHGPGVDRFDPPLSDRGARQAACLAERARTWRAPSVVLVSPAIRAQGTVAPLCSAIGTYSVIAPWLDEIQRVDGTSIDVASADLGIPPSTWDEFRARVTTGLADVLRGAGATPAPDVAPP